MPFLTYKDALYISVLRDGSMHKFHSTVLWWYRNNKVRVGRRRRAPRVVWRQGRNKVMGNLYSPNTTAPWRADRGRHAPERRRDNAAARGGWGPPSPPPPVLQCLRRVQRRQSTGQTVTSTVARSRASYASFHVVVVPIGSEMSKIKLLIKNLTI